MATVPPLKTDEEEIGPYPSDSWCKFWLPDMKEQIAELFAELKSKTPKEIK
jgi:hypothetical protein